MGNFAYRTEEKRSLSLVRYYGGKYYQTPSYISPIIELAKANHCHGYIEVTAGGARTLLNLPKNLFNCKVYNEFDLGLCKLFACVQDKVKAEELIRFLKNAPYDKAFFEWAKTNRKNLNDDLVIDAALTYICIMQSRNGDMEHFNLGRDQISHKESRDRFYHRIDTIRKITPVLQNTVITSADFRDVLETFQMDKHIIKFIDPPYHPMTRARGALDVYPCELSRADHKGMVDILVKSHSWILCGYDPEEYGCDDYKPLEESGAIKKSIGLFNLSSSNSQGSRKEEFIWIKY